MFPRSLNALLSALPCLCAVRVWADQPSYAIFRLQTEETDYQCGHASPLTVNSYGEAAGHNCFPGNRIVAGYPIFWSHPDSYTHLTTPNDKRAVVVALNDFREAVGVLGGRLDGGSDAVAWDSAGVFRYLPTLAPDLPAYPTDINNAGVVVGYARNLSGSTVAVFWSDDQIRALPLNADSVSAQALGVSGGGTACGFVERIDGEYPVVWEGSQPRFLQVPPDYVGGRARDVDDQGRCVGYVYRKLFDGSLASDPVRWDRHGRATLLNGTGGASTHALAFNALGQIVGGQVDTHEDTSGYRAGILWDASGMHFLWQLIPPGTGLSLTTAWDINDAGQIVGEANEDRYTRFRAVLLSPINPSFELDQAIPGFAGQSNSVSAHGLSPGVQVRFVASLHGGGAQIAGCDLQSGALAVQQPYLIGTAVADANGDASIDVFVQDRVRDLGDVFIQAFVPSQCIVSDLEVQQFN